MMGQKKQTLYILLMVLGGIVLAAGLVLGPRFDSNSMGGMLVGVGAGAASLGFSNWLILHWEKKDPQQMRRNEIEANDERNVAIRRRAQAVSGVVLQWGVIAMAWLSIGFGAPLWVTLAAVGVFVGKSVLELCLMARYQKQM